MKIGRKSRRVHIFVWKNEHKIIVDKLHRLYNKKNENHESLELNENKRCRRIIEKQRKLLEEMEKKNISKDSKRALEKKFNSIIFEISKSERLQW